MRLLEDLYFDKQECKYPDCSICLREFEHGESLKRIPNCAHVFHEACLRKWFAQAQICPTCRGNIIRMPSHNIEAEHVVQVSVIQESEEEAGEQ